MTYVVYAKAGSAAAIIDPVLDYDPKAARTSTQSADAVIEFVREERLAVEWILETHAHADHLSAAPYLKRMLGGKIGIGESIRARIACLQRRLRLRTRHDRHSCSEN